jgi:hypothetical protein
MYYSNHINEISYFLRRYQLCEKTFFWGASHPEDGFMKKAETFGCNDFFKLSFNFMYST